MAVSKVSIEIDGLKFGLRIPSELALQLVGALQAVWVAARHRREEVPLATSRAAARDAFENILWHISTEAQRDKAAADFGLVEIEPAELAKVIVLNTERRKEL